MIPSFGIQPILDAPTTRIATINAKKLRFHEHGPNELAHYAKKAFDIEYEFPFAWQEIEGIHNRTAKHKDGSLPSRSDNLASDKMDMHKVVVHY